MVCANKLDTRVWMRSGSGSAGTWLSVLSCLCVQRPLSSCRVAMRRDTHAMCTWHPVAMNSRLSLWPHVSAVTGD